MDVLCYILAWPGMDLQKQVFGRVFKKQVSGRYMSGGVEVPSFNRWVSFVLAVCKQHYPKHPKPPPLLREVWLKQKNNARAKPKASDLLHLEAIPHQGDVHQSRGFACEIWGPL